MFLSHIDLRVRDIAKATEFYDAILSPIGATKDVGKTFTTWQIAPTDAPDDWEPTADWFGITEDPQMQPGPQRIAFNAPSRGTIDAIATYLHTIGAQNIEQPAEVYGPKYYACFFDDPDGNKLELCCLD